MAGSGSWSAHTAMAWWRPGRNLNTLVTRGTCRKGPLQVPQKHVSDHLLVSQSEWHYRLSTSLKELMRLSPFGVTNVAA